jgi:hypothetical protein
LKSAWELVLFFLPQTFSGLAADLELAQLGYDISG